MLNNGEWQNNSMYKYLTIQEKVEVNNSYIFFLCPSAV